MVKWDGSPGVLGNIFSEELEMIEVRKIEVRKKTQSAKS
jgi:hypothetical protein